MARKKKRPPTFLEVACDRVGVRKGTDVMAFVIAWASTEAKLGHRPTVEEYAVDWKMSASTAYRELRLFRQAWPEFEYPSGLADLMQRTAREKLSWLAPVPPGVVRDV